MNNKEKNILISAINDFEDINFLSKTLYQELSDYKAIKHLTSLAYLICEKSKNINKNIKTIVLKNFQ